MKIRIILTMMEIILTGTLFADIEIFKFDEDPGFEAPFKSKWVPNGINSQKNCSIVPGGKNGNALLIDGQKSYGEVYSCVPLLINPEKDRVKLSIFAKGFGSFEILLFCYGKSYLGSVMLIKGICKEDGWNEFKTEFRFDKNKFKRFDDLESTRIAINVNKGGKIMFDDLVCERISGE